MVFQKSPLFGKVCHPCANVGTAALASLGRSLMTPFEIDGLIVGRAHDPHLPVWRWWEEGSMLPQHLCTEGSWNGTLGPRCTQQSGAGAERRAGPGVQV